MLKCEGYKMFKGLMRITPKNDTWPSHLVKGVWFYKPEYNCWYCNGSSYTADICSVEEDWTEGI